MDVCVSVDRTKITACTYFNLDSNMVKKFGHAKKKVTGILTITGIRAYFD